MIEVSESVRQAQREREQKEVDHIEKLCGLRVIYDKNAANQAEGDYQPDYKVNHYYLAKKVMELYHIKAFTRQKKLEYWYYNGKCYQPCSEQFITENLAYMGVLKHPEIDIPVIENIYMNKATKGLFMEKIKSMAAQDLRLDEMPINDKYIALNNGLYDWENDRIDPFTPDIWLTTFHKFNYSPNARSAHWGRFLSNMFTEEGQINQIKVRFIRQFIGSLFVPSKAIKIALFLKGHSDSGKTMLINIMEGIVGKENTSHVPLDKLNERFQLSNMIGKLLNAFGEVQEDDDSNLLLNKVVQSQIFKAITGKDTVQIERKGKDAFDFDNRAKLVYGMNNNPKIKDSGGGVSNRIYYMELLNTFSVGDRRRIEAIDDLIVANDLPAIFNWCMVGLRDLANSDWVFDNRDYFRISDVFRAVNNPVIEFILDAMEVDDDDVKMEIDRDFYEEYCSWYRVNGGGVRKPRMIEVREGFYNVGRVDNKLFKVTKAQRKYIIHGWKINQSMNTPSEQSGESENNVRRLFE
jgi:putative DNA primase/helicase